MRRLLVGASAALGLAGVQACTTPVEEMASAGSCTPTRSIYQPGVNGRPGTLINLPGNCPSPAQVARAEAAAITAASSTAAVTSPALSTGLPLPRARPEPVPLASVTEALDKGVGVICPWFFSPAATGSDVDPFIARLQRHGAENGFHGGSSLHIIFPMDPGQVARSSLGLQSNIQPPVEGSGVALFVQFHYPVCQLQVYGYAAESVAFVSGLEGRGWRVAAGPRRKGNVEVRRFRNSDGATLVTNRWVGSKAPDMKLLINYFSGPESTRGELTDG